MGRSKAVWVGFGSGFGIGWTLLLTRSSPSRHPPFTQYPSPSRSLVRDGQTSPHKPRLVVPHSKCPSLPPSPPAHSFIIGPAVINTHRQLVSYFPCYFPENNTLPLRLCVGRCPEDWHSSAGRADKLTRSKCTHAQPGATGHIQCAATASTPAARLPTPLRPPVLSCSSLRTASRTWSWMMCDFLLSREALGNAAFDLYGRILKPTGFMPL